VPAWLLIEAFVFAEEASTGAENPILNSGVKLTLATCWFAVDTSFILIDVELKFAGGGGGGGVSPESFLLQFKNKNPNVNERYIR
jgi:hypothetical protein